MSNATILNSQKAKINGKYTIVNTMLGKRHRQDIFYVVNGKQMDSNEFWSLNPKFVTQN